MWQNKSQGGLATANDTNTPKGSKMGGKSQQMSPNVDDNSKRSTNAPFAGYGKQNGFKPQYVNDSPQIGGNGSGGKTIRPRMGAARLGQGGFARVFKNNNNMPNIGAAGSGPSGSLSGIFGR